MLRKLNVLVGLLMWAMLLAVSGCGFSGKGGSLFRPDVALGITRLGTTAVVTPGAEFKFRVSISGTENRNVILDQVEDIAGGKVYDGNGISAPASVPVPDTSTPATDDYVWVVPSGGVRVGSTDFATIPSGTYVIRARSAEDSSRSATLTALVADSSVSILLENDTVPENPMTISAGETVDLKGVVQTSQGGSTAVQFALEGSSNAGGTIDSVSGLYTAPNGTTGGTDVVRCSLQSNAAVFALLTIQVVGARVEITPENPSVAINASIDLNARVLNRDNVEIHNNEVTWEVLDVNGNPDSSGTYGTIDVNGNYTAPGTGGLYRVRATNPQTTARAVIDILAKDVRVVVSPNGSTLTFGGSQDFNAQVLDANDVPFVDQTVAWTAPDGGTIDSNGLFTAPNTAGQYRVTATSSAAGRAATVTVLVTGNARIDISATTPDVRISGTKSFSATVRDPLGNAVPGATVTWSVLGGAGSGSINSSTGLYTAPNTPGQYTVRANCANPSAQGDYTVVVTDVVVNIPELGVTLTPGQSFDFDAFVTAQSDAGISQSVNWSASGGASISGAGLFTAPLTPGVFTVTATSTLVPRSDTAEVTVVAEGSVLVSDLVDAGDPTRHVAGMSIQMAPGARRSFKAYLPTTIGGTVTWSLTGGGSKVDSANEVTQINTSGTVNNQVLTLTARSVNDITKFATIRITIKTGTGDAGGTIGRPNR